MRRLSPFQIVLRCKPLQDWKERGEIMLDNSFQTMRDIGAEYGLTSHKLGKLLTEQGFRVNGKPAGKAFNTGWVQQRFAPDSANYMWAWHSGKCRILLDCLGHERRDDGTGQIVAM
jgi:hypothetical protein